MFREGGEGAVVVQLEAAVVNEVSEHGENMRALLLQSRQSWPCFSIVLRWTPGNELKKTYPQGKIVI